MSRKRCSDDAFMRDAGPAYSAGTLRPVSGACATGCNAYWPLGRYNTLEFLDRLKKETPTIELLFFSGNALPPVLSISSSLSDPHDCGRTVRIVTFEDEQEIVVQATRSCP